MINKVNDFRQIAYRLEDKCSHIFPARNDCRHCCCTTEKFVIYKVATYMTRFLVFFFGNLVANSQNCKRVWDYTTPLVFLSRDAVCAVQQGLGDKFLGES